VEAKHILLDMDGVVADFLNPAAAAVGLNLELVPKGTWDVFKEAGMDIADVWAKIDNYGFWRGLQPIHNAKSFFAVLTEHSVGVTFLTSCSRSSDCAKAKVEWLHAHFGPSVRALLCTGYASKALCAKPGNVLVDDCDRNIDSFRAAGGEAVLVPRPWNTDYMGGEERMNGTCYTDVDYNLVLERLGIPGRIADNAIEKGLV
jgi:5'(3')-deoxyribonucleotidase